MVFDMERKKDILDYDLDSLDLEIFSDTIRHKAVRKKSLWQDFLNNSYVKTGLTLLLLLFLFGSTFLIASRIAKPSFTTSSADVGYIPQAQIEIPFIPTNTPQPAAAKNCSEVSYDAGETTFLHSFCRGDICDSQPDKETCELVDVVVLKDDILSEESGQDGIVDCVWSEEEAVCKSKY